MTRNQERARQRHRRPSVFVATAGLVALLLTTAAGTAQSQETIERWLRDPAQRAIAQQAILDDPAAGCLALRSTDTVVREAALATLARTPKLLVEHNRVRQAAARAFTATDPVTRATLAMLLRDAFELPWPARAIRRGHSPAGGHGNAASHPNTSLRAVIRSLAGRALSRTAFADPGRFAQLLADHPRLACEELAARAELPVEVRDPLVRAFLQTTGDNLHLAEQLLRFETGRTVIRQHPDRLRGEVRRADLCRARAGCDLSSDAPTIHARWTDPTNRDYPTILRALGGAPAGAIAALRARLQADPVGGEDIAAALFAAGDEKTTRSWSQDRILAEPGWTLYTAKATLGPVLTEVVVGGLLADDPRPFLPTWHRLHDRIDLDEATRTAVALRLLALREAGDFTTPDPIDWPRGLLALKSEPQFARFFRRATERSYPDRFVTRVAAALLPSYPGLATAAIERGHKPAVVLANLARLDQPERLASHSAPLIDIARKLHQPPIAHALGAALARTGSDPLGQVLPLVDDKETRVFACHFLAGFGARGGAAIPKLNAIARSKNHRARFLAAHALAHLGPAGVARVAVLCNDNPELISALERAACARDHATIEAACHGLLRVQPGTNVSRAFALRGQLDRGLPARLEGLVFLAMLAAEPTPRDSDWLRVAALEPGILRRRALEALTPRANKSLHYGALVELLDDPTPAIARHAAKALLEPLRLPHARHALAQFAARATTPDSLTLRIQAALAATPDTPAPTAPTAPGKGATSRGR
ncbi:MAG: hypothetical protein NXI31_22755 [bacterium]|nr:hypothetical protein [bacterium]